MLIRDRIALHHADLTPQLRVAARYVAEHPAEIATRSLRTVAARTNTSPATFTRLARALGFQGYEELRELCRTNLKQRIEPLASRAKNLQQHRSSDHAQAPLLYRHAGAVIDNINELVQQIDMNRLRSTADALVAARRVYLLGALSSAAITRFWGYIARLAFDHWQVVNEGEGQLASTLQALKSDDFFVVLSQQPHARWSMLAAQEIRQCNGQLLVLTDSYSCPAIRYADYHFVVPDDSPQFFSSYVSILVLIETLMGMVIARAGADVPQQIEAIVENNFRLGQYWQE
ncbi:MAG: MurR/RpiR family transcriptional regulator [Thiolinea sp.]